MPSCPQCGSEPASGDPAGLCPMCLIQGALGSSGADEFNTRTAGAAAELAPDEDFGLALWKDADADIPILKSARAEYARL